MRNRTMQPKRVTKRTQRPQIKVVGELSPERNEVVKDALDKFVKRIEPPKAMENMNVFKRRLERAIE